MSHNFFPLKVMCLWKEDFAVEIAMKAVKKNFKNMMLPIPLART